MEFKKNRNSLSQQFYFVIRGTLFSLYKYQGNSRRYQYNLIPELWKLSQVAAVPRKPSFVSIQLRNRTTKWIENPSSFLLSLSTYLGIALIVWQSHAPHKSLISVPSKWNQLRQHTDENHWYKDNPYRHYVKQ